MVKGNVAIAYQNKDIISKIWAEELKNKSLNIYGINIPKIKEVLPTNLPDIEVNENRIDNLFLLEDGSFAIVDYESVYDEGNKLKYIRYIQRVLQRLYSDKYNINDIHIRMIVIYTADIKKGTTKSELDVSSLKISIAEGFLSEIDSEGVRKKLEAKIKKREMLSDDELMQLAILPMTYRGKKRQQQAVGTVAELICQIEETQRTLAYVNLLTFNDKIIDEYLAEKIRRILTMTKVGRLIAEEIDEKVRQKTEIITEQVTQQVTQQVTEQAIQKLVASVKKLTGAFTDAIEQLVEQYGYDEKEAEEKARLYW